MRALELKVPPLALWVAFAAAGSTCAIVAPSLSWPFPGHRVVASLLALCGGALCAAAVVQFRMARTTVNPLAPTKSTSVVKTGAYAISRNPMYLGMALALLAVALWWVNLPALLLTPAFFAYLTRFQIEPEERALLRAFGQEFSAYQATVRRWV